MTLLMRRQAGLVFLAFAFAYFLSALIRAVTATLSPTLTQEFTLNARDLGLLAGGYFAGFSLVQLPLGAWLDRHGPKKVILSFLTVAVVGCLAFAAADDFKGLLLARLLCGIGVGACLMAPLTGYRRWFETSTQLRANSWMLMTGSLGMVASTLPVQWLMPLIGWRGLFVSLALLVLVSMVLIYGAVPAWVRADGGAHVTATPRSYAEVWRHPYFRRMAPMGFVNYGGLIAIQTLWASPWMIRVGGYTPIEAATGLFWINVAMLCAFWTWGWAMPWLTRRGWSVDRLMLVGMPLSLALLAALIWVGTDLTGGAMTVALALYCVGTTFGSLAQPAVGMAFPAALAGRALSAYNLVIFAGVFVAQWGIGLLIDGFAALGWAQVAAMRAAFGVYLLLCVLAYLHFLLTPSHNRAA